MYVPVSERKKKEQAVQSGSEAKTPTTTRSTTGGYVPVSQRTGEASKTNASPAKKPILPGLKPFTPPAPSFNTANSTPSGAKPVAISNPAIDQKILDPLGIKKLIAGASKKQDPTLSEYNNAKLKSDTERGVTISQGQEDLVQKARQSLSKIPLVGKFLTGTGPQGPSEQLYTPGSIPQTLVEKGIAGFLFEGFQKKLNPTDAELADQIMTRYDKLGEKFPDKTEKERLDIAIQDVKNQSSKTPSMMRPGEPGKAIDKLADPGVELSKEDKSALRVTNLLEDAFAVLDAPIFVGSTKVAKGPITAVLKNLGKAEDITPILRRLDISKEVADEVAPKIAESTNELKISKLIDEAVEKTKTAKVPDEAVNVAKVDSEAFKKAVTSGDEAKAVDDALKIFDNGKGNTVIDPDALKKVAGMTDPKDHETFSDLAKKTFTKALETDTNDTVRFLAGGSGSGKSENILKGLEADKRVNGIIVDGVMADYDSAIKKLAEVEAHGKAVEINAILPDIARAWRWAQSRAIRTGREVPLDVFIDKHVGFANTIKKLAEDGFKINLLDTRKVASKADYQTKAINITDPRDIVATVEDLGYNVSDLKQKLQNVKLTEKQYRKAKAKRETALRSERVPEKKSSGKSGRHENSVFQQRGNGGNGRDPGRSRVVDKKLEEQVDQSTSFNHFVNKTGITKEALDATVKKKGFDSAEDYYKATKAKLDAKEIDLGTELTPAEIARKARKIALDKKGGVLSKAEALEYKKLELEFAKDAIDANPAKQLSKYAPKVGENAGSLGEVTGIGKSKWATQGDEIAGDLGFESTEIARAEFDKYVKQRQRLAEMIEEVQSHTQDYRNTKKILEALKAEIKAEGVSRQKELANVRDFFHFSQHEWNRILKRSRFQDPRLYNDTQWSDFMERIHVEGEATFRAIERRVELKSLIFEREFKKTENMFQAMGYPSLEQMTEKQLSEMIDVLENFKLGDEFLTKRQIETVSHTDIADIRTIREALESLAKDAGVEPGSIGKVAYKEMDEYRYDSALARQNPFYDVMVTEKNRAFIEAGENVIKIRERLDDLIGKARKSTKRGILDRFVPTDKKIFDWLESDALGKAKMAEDMTAEEIEAGQYIRNLYEQARDYLVQMQVLKKYRSDYITHIRRGFLETWKDDGLIKAFRESFDQYKQDEAYLNILDGDTGEILPLEKFFQFSMQRTGGLVPTKNVARAVETYFRTFERKVALDSLVPKIDIYAHALSPRVYSERGLELDRSLKKFTKKWLNTKKGRVAETIVKPGGRIDWILRSGVALTRIIDLGFSVPVGVASFFGEQSATFVNLGARKMSLGSARMLTKRGQQILKQNETFIGESTLTKLRNQASDPGDKLMTGMFALFAESARTANAQHLLGSLTKQEFKTGEISAKRLAVLRKEMGRYRVVEEAESVMGKTSLGKVATQYRTWAVPIIHTTIDNLKTIQRIARKDGVKAVMKRPEVHELFRSAMLAGGISLAMGGYARSLQNKKDRNFAEQLVVKAYQDSLTLIGAMDPNLFTSQARFNAFIADLVQGMTDIVSLEDGFQNPKWDIIKSGKNKGKNRGTTRLKKTVTPKVFTQFGNGDSKKATPAPETGPDLGGSLPDLPTLPTLPKLPDLPTL